MKFVTMRVTAETRKAAQAIAKRDGVKLWKVLETAVLSSQPDYDPVGSAVIKGDYRRFRDLMTARHK